MDAARVSVDHRRFDRGHLNRPQTRPMTASPIPPLSAPSRLCERPSTPNRPRTGPTTAGPTPTLAPTARAVARPPIGDRHPLSPISPIHAP